MDAAVHGRRPLALQAAVGCWVGAEYYSEPAWAVANAWGLVPAWKAGFRTEIASSGPLACMALSLRPTTLLLPLFHLGVEPSYCSGPSNTVLRPSPGATVCLGA